MMSTTGENTVLMGYFSKITDFIGIYACSLSGFCWPRFCHVFYEVGGGERLQKGPLLPVYEITSENWGNGGFCSGVY